MKIDPETLALIVALSRKEVVRNVSVFGGKTGLPGKDGLPGSPGKDGKDGLPGSPGRNGKDGLPGSDGAPGKDGRNGKNGKNGAFGRDGQDGKPGRNGEDGVGVKSALVDSRGHLIVSLTDGETIDAGLVRGPKGDKGDKGEPGSRGRGGGVVRVGSGLPDDGTEGQIITADADGKPVWEDAPSGVVVPTIPSIADLTMQPLGVQVESEPVSVSGEDGTIWPVTVRGEGDPQIQVSGGEWSQHAAVFAGDTVALRLTTSDIAVTTRSATLHYQGGSVGWSVESAPVFPELMPNSTFDTTDGFSLQGNWTITGGQLVQTGALSTGEYAITTLIGPSLRDRPVRIIADVAVTSGSTVQFRLGGGDGGTNVITQTLVAGVTVIDTIWTGTTNAVLIRLGQVGATISFNSISIKERLP